MLLHRYNNAISSVAWKRRDVAASGKPRGNAKCVANAVARHCLKSIATLGTRVRRVCSWNYKLTTHVQSTQVRIAALSIHHRRHQDHSHHHNHLHDCRRFGRAGNWYHLLLLYLLCILKIYDFGSVTIVC